MRRRPRTIETEARALVSALRDAGDAALADKLAGCGTWQADHIDQWPQYCRSPACPSCRRWAGARWRNRVRDRLSAARNEECAMVTVMIARVGALSDMPGTIRDFKAALRNLRDRLARKSARWSSVELHGSFEVEPLTNEDVARLPPRRRRVVQNLPAIGGGDGTWVLHAHIAVASPNLLDPIYEIRDALSQQWPGAGRVDVAPFLAHQDVEENADAVSRYQQKGKCVVRFMDEWEEPWPVAYQAEWWSWVCGHRRGWAPIRFSVGPRSGAGMTKDREQVDRHPRRDGGRPQPVAHPSGALPRSGWTRAGLGVRGKEVQVVEKPEVVEPMPWLVC